MKETCWREIVKIKRKISLRHIEVNKVLDALGIVYEKRSDELYTKCLHPEHKERKPSWHIRSKVGDEKNGVFNCWSCGWKGNLVTLVCAVKGVGFKVALSMVEEFQKSAAVYHEATDKDYEKGFQMFEPAELKDYKWNEKRIKTYPIRTGGEAFEYLIGRNIGSRYVEECGLLDWPEKGRIIVPIRRRGKLISWVARSYRGENPKTIAPQGAPKKWELLGFDEMCKMKEEVNLCEGWVDRVRLMQIGCVNPCALCGSKMSEHQADAISFAKKVTIWQDGDRAGEVMSRDLSSWLGRGRELFIVRFPKGRDPGSYSPAELTEFKPVPWNTDQVE
jgi:DNA primase